MPNMQTVDVEQIAAKWLLVNLAICKLDANTGSISDVKNALQGPSPTQLTTAINQLHQPNLVNCLGTCNPCTVGGQQYFGLTFSECVAIGGTCQGQGRGPSNP
jgi:hypothetical protein